MIGTSAVPDSKTKAPVVSAPASPLSAPVSALLRGVEVSLEARLGRAEMTVEAMMGLKAGSVVTLDASLADHVDLYLNGTVVARGEIVAAGDRFGVRIIDIPAAS